MIPTQNFPDKPKIIVSNGEISAETFSLTVLFIKPSLINLQYVTMIKVISHAIDERFWTSFDELNIPKCTHLSFEKCTFPNGFSNLYSYFKNLSIINCGLTDQSFFGLFHYLNPYVLQNLDVQNNKIGEQQQTIEQILQRSLPDRFALRTINFSGNPMRGNFIQKLQEQYSERTKIIYDVPE